MAALIVGICGLGSGCSATGEDDSLTLLTILAVATYKAPLCTASNFSLVDDASVGTSYGNGTAIQTNNVTFIGSNSNCRGVGTVQSYSISPALPTGLTMSTSTGAITGTPTATSAKATYTRTANVLLTYTEDGVSMTSNFTMTDNTQITVAANAANVTCNSVGTFAGCTASFPFSCTNEPVSCFKTYSLCRSDVDCNYYL